MSAPPSPSWDKRVWLFGVLVVVLLGGGFYYAFAPLIWRWRRPKLPMVSAMTDNPRLLVQGEHLTLWWDSMPSAIHEKSLPSGEGSNIHPADYIGPESCKRCHPGNHELWLHHAHRRMNARADSDNVMGDFSPQASIAYRGGKATFSHRADKYFMHLERGVSAEATRRTYEIHQTIGSRFFQYYVGKQIEGPEPKSHHFYHKDHLLSFGYWLALKEWVPVVHIGPELGDDQRIDPFVPPESGQFYAEYAVACNACHTTFPLADMFGRRPPQMGEFAPASMHWSLLGFFQEAHPRELDSARSMLGPSKKPQELQSVRAVAGRGTQLQNPMLDWDASEYGVTLGVSCEACHLGAREHVESEGRVKPRFFPSSPHLRIEGSKAPETGRTHDNVNWACGRCHVGPRPQFAGGMSTWNSVEYSDAMRGSCYSKLRCVDCHNPHRTIGPKWSLSADQDDALCLKCHQKFEPNEARVRHTHHPMGSEGSRCMNCHMPRIYEGVEDVVRTHMIFSPSRADMIEANHPNACNLCHTDKPIDWTLKSLKEWYGKTYEENRIASHYPRRGEPVALGWLKSDNASVRLVATEAVARRRDFSVLPQLLDSLDDSHLINRQFAYKGLQEMLHVHLGDFGYRFYLTKEERREPLSKLRARFAAPRSEPRP